MLNTPVVLLIFNRPTQTQQTFDAIAQARPKKLFVIADGPRSPEEAQLCASTRAVTERVDWECEVVRCYSSTNRGCRETSATGFDWVFSQVDEAIFLDDDCVPDPTFFPFCEECLAHYRSDTRVMCITGSNYLESWMTESQSYHFSYFGSPWGWASWKRAWQHFDNSMQGWGDPEVKARIRDVLAEDESYAIQASRFDRVYNDPGNRQSWDIAWTCARLDNSGLTVVPAVNLVTNIGCCGESTISPDWPTANLPRGHMAFPMRHPSSVAVDRVYDLRHIRRVVGRDALSGESLFGPTEPHRSNSPKAIARRMRRRVAPSTSVRSGPSQRR